MKNQSMHSTVCECIIHLLVGTSSYVHMQPNNPTDSSLRMKTPQSENHETECNQMYFYPIERDGADVK